MQLGVGGDFVDPVDRPGWDARSREHGEPMGARLSPQDLLYKPDDFRPTAAAFRVRSVPRMFGHLRPTHGLPKSPPDTVVAQPERDRKIGGREGLVNGDHAVLPARATRCIAGPEVWNDSAGQKACHRIDERDVDRATLAISATGKESRDHREGRILSGQHVGCGRTDLLRLAVGFARQIHYAGVAFGDQVVTGPVGALAGETEPAYGDVYEIRLDRPEGLWIDAELCRDSGRLIHHDHVTPGREFTQNLQTFWLRVIQAQAPLISVHAQEPERFSVEEWWSPGARVIADPRTLDLEDLGAHVGEQHRRKWTCDRGGKIEDADSREKIEALTGLEPPGG